MALLFAVTDRDPAPWVSALERALPYLEIRVWPDVGAPEEIEFAIVWALPLRELRRFPGLKVIFSLGAGVDGLLADPDRPPDVPLVRMIDPGLREAMTEFLVMRTLHYHRHMPDYEAQQRKRIWRVLAHVAPGERRVGIMGLGVLGAHAGSRLTDLGFAVAGWTRTAKDIARIENFHGEAALVPFLNRSHILICLLPLTPATENILDAAAFAALPAGACIINCGRGAQIVDADLLAALDSGHLAGATLDVFRTEPLPASHPFWGHPKVSVVPHIAALTMPETAAPVVADNIRRWREDKSLLNGVDPQAGY